MASVTIVISDTGEARQNPNAVDWGVNLDDETQKLLDEEGNLPEEHITPALALANIVIRFIHTLGQQTSEPINTPTIITGRTQ